MTPLVFHAQQSAEKYLKAYSQAINIPISEWEALEFKDDREAKQFLFCKSASLIGGSHLVSLGK